MKQRKTFHPEAGVVRRFLRQFTGGFAQRRRIRQSLWYAKATPERGRRMRPRSAEPALNS